MGFEKTFAQTFLQLINQMSTNDYSSGDLKACINAYRLAMALCSGKYRSNGKSLLAHVVGTASILVDCCVPVEFVCACLLHASLQGGDRPRNEQLLLEHAGESLTRILSVYQDLEWNKKSIDVLVERFEQLTGEERCAVAVRLANEVEDHLDSGMHYMSEARIAHLRKRYQEASNGMIRLADLLGYPALAKAILDVRRASLDAQLPEVVSDAIRDVRVTAFEL